MPGESVSKLLYAHDPSRPRAPGSDTDFKITVTNQRHLSLEKLDADHRHDYRLTVVEPLSLGLPRLDDYYGNKFMQQIVTACNLVMDKAAFSTHSSDSTHVEICPERPPPTTIKIESTPTGMRASGREFVPPPTESLSYKVCDPAELNEALAVDALRKIQVVFGASKPPLKIHNMRKSLDRYLEGTQTTNKYGAFMQIYASLEHAVNFDRPCRKASCFDKEICDIMKDKTLPIKDLRCLNARIKHADSEGQDVVYEASKGKMAEKIGTLRPIASGVILRRLA